MFDRFHRVEGAQGRSHEGSGIGLALVQELVKLHGGELTATSVLGQGSVFTVSMPLGAAHLPADQVAAERDAPSPLRARRFTCRKHCAGFQNSQSPRPSPSAGASERGADTGAHVGRVLLADDNADMRDYAERLLAERWQVDTASNGRAALDARACSPPRRHRHRRDDAGARWLRPAAGAARRSGTARRPGHHAVGARRRGSAPRGPDGLRRRLSGEAVLGARSPGACRGADRQGPRPCHRAAACAAVDAALHSCPGRRRGAVGARAPLRADQLPLPRADRQSRRGR